MLNDFGSIAEENLLKKLCLILYLFKVDNADPIRTTCLFFLQKSRSHNTSTKRQLYCSNCSNVQIIQFKHHFYYLKNVNVLLINYVLLTLIYLMQRIHTRE